MTASSYTRAACQVAGGQFHFRQGVGTVGLHTAAALQEAARALQHQQGQACFCHPLSLTPERGKVKP